MGNGKALRDNQLEWRPQPPETTQEIDQGIAQGWLTHPVPQSKPFDDNHLGNQDRESFQSFHPDPIDPTVPAGRIYLLPNLLIFQRQQNDTFPRVNPSSLKMRSIS